MIARIGVFAALAAACLAAPRAWGQTIPLADIPTGHDCADVLEDDDYKVTNCNATIFVAAESFSFASSGLDTVTDKSLVIRASEVNLDTNWKAPGQSLFIICDTFTHVHDTTIDVTGADGASYPAPPDQIQEAGKAGTAGKDGVPGQNGGRIFILADTYTPAEDGPLNIVTHGGNGGNGQDGGNGTVGVKGTDSSACVGVGAKGGATNGGRGGAGGRAGAGGNGGNGGTIEIKSTNAIPNAAITRSFLPGTPGKPGKAGRPGVGGDGGASYTHHWETKHFFGLFHKDHHCTGAAGAQGPKGALAPPPDATAHGGREGSFIAGTATMADFGAYETIPAMKIAMTEANAFYRNNQFEEARDHYMFVLNVTRSMQNETTSVADNTTLNAMESVVTARLGNMKMGVDFYGNRFDHCPSLSLSYYENRAKEVIEDAKLVETAYHMLQDETTTLLAKRSSITTLMNKLRSQISTYKSDNSHLAQQASDLAAKANEGLKTIQDIQVSVQEAQWSCIEAIEIELEKEQQKQLWTDLFDVVTMVIDIGGALKGLVSDFQGLLSAVKNLKVSFANIGTMIKDIKSLYNTWEPTIAGDVNQIWSEYNEFKNDIHNVETRDQAKITVDTKHLNEFLSKYQNLPQCATLQTQFNQLTSVAQTRNGQVLTHDKYIMEMALNTAKAKQASAQLSKDLPGLLSTYDPTIFSDLREVEQVYRSVLDDVAEVVYEMHRSYTCNTQDQTFVPVDTTSLATLQYSSMQIGGLITKSMEASPYTSAQFTTSDLALSVNHDDAPFVFKGLEHRYSLNISVPLGHPSFRGMANVHLLDHELCVEGADIPSGQIRAIVSRAGTAYNMDVFGTVTKHSRTPLTEMKIVDTNCGKAGSVMKSGQMAAAAVGADGSQQVSSSMTLAEQATANMAPDSPFTVWNVAIPQELNPGVDLNGVHAVHLRLSTVYQPIMMPGASAPYYLGGVGVNGTQAWVGSTGSSASAPSPADTVPSTTNNHPHRHHQGLGGASVVGIVAAAMALCGMVVYAAVKKGVIRSPARLFAPVAQKRRLRQERGRKSSMETPLTAADGMQTAQRTGSVVITTITEEGPRTASVSHSNPLCEPGKIADGGVRGMSISGGVEDFRADVMVKAGEGGEAAPGEGVHTTQTTV